MARLSRPRFARTLYLNQILLMFDGPQVVLMKSDRGFPVIGVALDSEDYAEQYMHFTEISDEVLRRYLNEKVDLRYLFRQGSKRRYLGGWSELDEQGWLPVQRADDFTDESAFPGPGFWARHHSEELGDRVYGAQSLASFAIDGSWDASDFSRFYGKMADLYAFLAITSPQAAAALSVDMLASVKSTIQSLGWRGGGSYVGFYDSVFARVYALIPLSVRRISYASPGTIDLQGSPEPLKDVAKVVQQFAEDDGTLKLSASIVDKLLSREGLKRSGPGADFHSQAHRSETLARCFTINERLGVEQPDQLLSLCDGNVVVFAKITLSFYRRARDLHAFHAEGRVSARSFELEESGIEA